MRVTKDTLVFSAAHFITFNRNVCERIHGHNWGVEGEIEGPLDENHYVFIDRCDGLQALVHELDHRVLLPDRHPLIQVVISNDEQAVILRFENRRWVFPREDTARFCRLKTRRRTHRSLDRNVVDRTLEAESSTWTQPTAYQRGREFRTMGRLLVATQVAFVADKVGNPCK